MLDMAGFICTWHEALKWRIWASFINPCLVCFHAMSGNLKGKWVLCFISAILCLDVCLFSKLACLINKASLMQNKRGMYPVSSLNSKMSSWLTDYFPILAIIFKYTCMCFIGRKKVDSHLNKLNLNKLQFEQAQAQVSNNSSQCAYTKIN